MNAPRASRMILCLLSLTLVASSCEEKFVSLTPEAPPGGAARVQVRGVDLQRATGLRAVVGGKPVPVRVIDERTAEVLIPWLDPGVAELTLLAGDRELGRVDLTITDTAARRLRFSIGASRVELILTDRSAGAVTPNVRSNRERISFDLVNAQGALIYSGSILHPLHEGGEVFSFSEAGNGVAPARLDPPDSSSFDINIPTPPTGTILRIYDVPAGLDITTPEGRERRILRGEWTL